MLIDYHIHSHFSCDSDASLNGICEAALAKGLSQIAITDHVDLQCPKERQDPTYVIADFDRYFHDIQDCRTRYPELVIRTGVEIGFEARRLADYDALLRDYPFDFVIASLHAIDGMEPHLGEYYQNKTKEEAYRKYYHYIGEFVEMYDNFDVVGHLDYVKRYMPEPYAPGDHLLAWDAMERLLTKVIAKGKGIEVNTSGFRHVSQASMPHLDIVARYYQLGGRRITVGSDSHEPQYLGLRVAETLAALKAIGFETVSTFEQRREIPLAI